MAKTLESSSVASQFAGPNLKIISGASTVQGQRRDNNEDCSYISPDMDLFIVADGMGGHEAGEIASRFAVDVLSHELAKALRDSHTDQEVEALVQAALSRTNCLITSIGDESLFRGAATTVVLALLFKSRLFVLGVGDSRAYLIRNHEIVQLTRDDSFPQVLADAGVITQEQVRTHPARNQLLASLGIRDFDPSNRIRLVELQAGDRFLLTSDGITDVLEDKDLLRIVSDVNNPQDAAQSLVEHAIDNNAGDDLTCIVFHTQALDDEGFGTFANDTHNPSYFGI